MKTTRAGLLAQIADAREGLRRLRTVCPGAFNANGKAIVAELRMFPEPTKAASGNDSKALASLNETAPSFSSEPSASGSKPEVTFGERSELE